MPKFLTLEELQVARDWYEYVIEHINEPLHISNQQTYDKIQGMINYLEKYGED